MFVKKLFAALLLLVTGAVAGFFLSLRQVASVPKEATPKERRASTPIADAGSQASLTALRSRISDLEAQLAAANARVSPSNGQEVVAVQAPKSRPEGMREGFRERMERLKKDDPAEYANMTNRMTQWRRHRAEQHQAKLDFLSSVDTSHMSAAAKKSHQDLQEALARRDELERQMQDENLTDDERHALMQEMHESWREMQRLNGEVRKNLIEETARNLGFAGEDVKEISLTMQEIIEATDSFGGRGRFGRRGAPPPHR